jgi:hypothetical protein
MALKSTFSNTDIKNLSPMTIEMLLSNSQTPEAIKHIGQDFLKSAIYVEECAIFKTSSKARIRLTSKNSKSRSSNKKSRKNIAVVSKFDPTPRTDNLQVKLNLTPSFEKKTDITKRMLNNVSTTNFKSSLFKSPGSNSTTETTPMSYLPAESECNTPISTKKRFKKDFNSVKLEIEKIANQTNSPAFESK